MTLHLIPLPYADPDDVTLRALRLLRTVPLIVPADCLTALHSLTVHHGLTPVRLIDPTDSEAVSAALHDGECACVTRSHRADDAAAVIALARQHGVKVEPISGGDRVIAALVLSALPPDTFVYIGSPPDGLAALGEWLSAYAGETATLVFTVPGARLAEAIAAVQRAFAGRQACAIGQTGGEMQIVRGMVGDWVMPDGAWTGEVAIALAGAPKSAPVAWDEARITAALRARLDSGEPLKVAAKALAADSGWDRRTIYALGVALRDES